MRSHDVRHLTVCRFCAGLGDDREMLEIAHDNGPNLAHGRCVVERLSEAELMALPPPQLFRLRLSETGIELMKRLLDQYAIWSRYNSSASCSKL